jgi:hypothetical protein
MIRYYVARRLLYEDAGHTAPRRGDVKCFEGVFYRVADVVHYCPMCPPDTWHVFLEMTDPEPFLVYPH